MSGAVLIRLSAVDGESALLDEHSRRWLSDSERVRLQSIRHAQVRRRFLAGHWLARRLLADYAGGRPDQWRLSEAAGGAPLVHHVDGRSAPHLSLSHSGALLACAVGDVELGVDLEVPTRTRNLQRIAEQVFSREEQDTLLACPDHQGEHFFHVRWTLREAWLKRHGCGLSAARMRAMRVHRSGPDAHAWTWSGNRRWLALCAAPGIQVSIEGGEDVQADAAWRVEDEDAAAAASPH